MERKMKSEQDRMSAMEKTIAGIRADVDKLAIDGDFAITPLPRTIAQGGGKSACGATTPVHNVTTAGNLTLVVENGGGCAVSIQVKRGNGIVGQSPQAAKPNSASVGPVAVQPGDVVEVVCVAGTQKCEFNYQVNA